MGLLGQIGRKLPDERSLALPVPMNGTHTSDTKNALPGEPTNEPISQANIGCLRGIAKTFFNPKKHLFLGGRKSFASTRRRRALA